MPIHDWTRVTPNIFHHFHNTWIGQLALALNDRVLPEGYYALSEQSSGDVVPDLLTLEKVPSAAHEPKRHARGPHGTALAVEEAPPEVAFHDESQADWYARRRRSLLIFHEDSERIIALVEILSLGNKRSHKALDAFLDKTYAALGSGQHLLVVDLYSPGSLDPNGIHAAIWETVEGKPYHAPKDKPLTLASYDAGIGSPVSAYVQPVAVGGRLTDMPLFLEPRTYVRTPLEETYMQAFAGMPAHLQEQLENA